MYTYFSSIIFIWFFFINPSLGWIICLIIGFVKEVKSELSYNPYLKTQDLGLFQLQGWFGFCFIVLFLCPYWILILVLSLGISDVFVWNWIQSKCTRTFRGSGVLSLSKDSLVISCGQLIQEKIALIQLSFRMTQLWVSVLVKVGPHRRPLVFEGFPLHTVHWKLGFY